MGNWNCRKQNCGLGGTAAGTTYSKPEIPDTLPTRALSCVSPMPFIDKPYWACPIWQIPLHRQHNWKKSNISEGFCAPAQVQEATRICDCSHPLFDGLKSFGRCVCTHWSGPRVLLSGFLAWNKYLAGHQRKISWHFGFSQKKRLGEIPRYSPESDPQKSDLSHKRPQLKRGAFLLTLRWGRVWEHLLGSTEVVLLLLTFRDS